MKKQVIAFIITAIMLVAAQDVPAQDTAFRLGVGDKLRITVFEEPGMSGDYAVGARGRLSLPLIGELVASDITLAELERRITEALADGFIQNASVSVELLESRPFYILGDISNPGSYPYVDGMTVVNAIALAGGKLITQEDEVRAMVEVARSRERRDLLAKDYLSTLAREARLIAERDDLADIDYPPALKQAAGHQQIKFIVEGENRIFQARRGALTDQYDVIQKLKASVRKEVAAYSTQMAAIRDQVDVINQLLADQNKLLAQNLTRKAQVMDLQIRAAGSRVTRGGLLVQIARAEQRLQELDLQVTESRNRFISEVADGLVLAQSDLSRIRTSLQTAHQELRQNRRKLGRARSALAGERTLRVTITRRTESGVLQLEAEESTPIAPGDIVKVADEIAQDIDDFSFDISSLIESFSTRSLGEQASQNESGTEGDAGDDAGATEPTGPTSDQPDSAQSDVGVPAGTGDPTEPETKTADGSDSPTTETAAKQENTQASTDVKETDPLPGQSPSSGADETSSAASATASEDAGGAEASGVIKSIQIGLNVLGFTGDYRLAIDGIIGPRTEDAIKAYQRQHDLPSNGIASPELLQHIQSQLN